MGTETLHGQLLLAPMSFLWHKVLEQYEFSPAQTCLQERLLTLQDIMRCPSMGFGLTGGVTNHTKGEPVHPAGARGCGTAHLQPHQHSPST